MKVRKQSTRNREIFAAYQHGETLEDIAKRYALSRLTVAQIVRFERYKIAVSVDAFYETMRSQ